MIEPGQAFSDLAVPACQRALEMAGIPPEKLDLIIVGTSSGDMITPSSACILQHRLGAKRAVGFDVSAACPGFIYGLSVAQKFIQDGSHDLALVVGGEVISNRIDYGDRATCVLFGDGAGAAVVGPSNGTGEGEILSTHLHSDGSLWELLLLPGGGSRHPPSHEMVDKGLHYLKMQGNEVFKHAVRCMCDAGQRVLAQNGLTVADVKWVIPHQANLRIIDAIHERLDVPREKFIINLDRYGNTSAASVVLALDEAVKQGRIKKRDKVLMIAFGGGFTWGASVVEWYQ